MIYWCAYRRMKQPFNSLLNETYEYVKDDLRALFEQVNNHPPILAYYIESNDFVLQGNMWLKSKLSLSSFEFLPIGFLKLRLKRTNEVYDLKRPITTIHNYILGKIYMWVKGTLVVKNVTT